MQNGPKQQFYSISRKLLQTNTGIITGDNNSVIIANVALHFIMIRVPHISKILLLGRFIDDIIFIAKNNEISKEIIKNLKQGFEK